MALAMAASVRSKRPYHHGDLKRALVREAAACLQRRGVEALTLRGVARSIDVSPAAPYAHFRHKEDLLAAVAEDGYRTLTSAMRRVFASAPDDPWERLVGMGVEYVRFAVEFPAHYRLMFGPDGPPVERHPDLHQAAHASAGGMITAIADCQNAGQLRAGDPMEIALFLWSALHGFALLLAGGRLPAQIPRRGSAPIVNRLARAHMSRLLQGLLVGAPAAPGRSGGRETPIGGQTYAHSRGRASRPRRS